MKKLLMLAALAIAIYAALAATAAAAPGCCCNPITQEGFLVADRTNCDPAFNFTESLPDATRPTCNDICNAEFAPPIVVPPAAGCDNPLFKPAPAALQVKAVKNKKQLRLTFTIPCPATKVTIERCAGAACEDFELIAQTSPTSVYTDVDANLQWNKDYTYQVTAHYVKSGQSEPAIGRGNAGDIECWHHGSERFCLSQFSYEQFRSYLHAFGYSATAGETFQSDFAAATDLTFQTKYNKGWYCDDFNRLGVTGSACTGSQQCVADDAGVNCVIPTPCASTGLFGLFSTVPDCEGSATFGTKKYCFFDRSQGSIDTCYSCSPRMACADYRSAGACARDNCNAGACVWRDTFPDIGAGVCLDTRFPNCPTCTANGTAGMENNAAYNEVFDQCTERKAGALSLPDYPCTFNKNAQESNGCDATACMDYSDAACGSPADGIMLNPDNTPETESTDACGIKVCQVMGVAGCSKNYDGNAVPDCAPTSGDRRVCELDHFPPETSLVSRATGSRMDWLDVTMFDRINGTEDGAFRQGTPGYRLRVCVVGPGRTCSEAASFTETNGTLLNFNDLNLQAGRTVIATLADGVNALKYYGVDNHSNPEIVREVQVTACSLCQGPKALEISVIPGREFNGNFYTIADLPVIRVTFNEPATLTSAVLVSGTAVIPLTATPSSGANYEYQFVPLRALPDGDYTLTFNAQDANGKLMDVPGTVHIVVDSTPGEVTITPADGSVLTDTSVDVSFTFSEPLTLVSAVLENEVWISPYGVHKDIIDLKPLLASTDQATYTATITGLNGGKKNIRVQAEDFSGNPTIGKSSFWIDAGSLQIRLREPAWGVSAATPFDLTIDTTRTAECRYLYDAPTAPPSNYFDVITAFPEENGVTHTIPNFDRIAAGDLSPHPFHAYCKMGDDVVVESFVLRIDPTAPNIKAAFAQPSVIIERLLPGVDIYATTLKAQTDDEGFCRYSTQNVPFILMEGQFSGFDEYPKQSHDADINVSQDKASYTYYVACKNKAQQPSATVPVQFSVDTGIPFSATSATPLYSNTTAFDLRVETNKRAFCYYGETADTVLNCMGACDYGYAHIHPIEAAADGNNTWHIKCSTGAGDEVATLVVPVVVDTTPPEMDYVDDTSNIIAEPEYSYFLDQLQLDFLGFENESGVKAYYYRITTFFSNETVLNWTLSTSGGTPFMATGFNLTDGNKYKAEAYAVNLVGLQSEPMASNGVTVDVERMPAACANGAQDEGETAVDCGGTCGGCIDGSACTVNTDCGSGYCNGGVCAASACDDGVKNANETDIDCGGGVCLACGVDKVCVQNTDCATNSCNFGVCGEPDPCADGTLTGAESDVDCGGACSVKCGDGKNCKASADCDVGLMCLDSTCQTSRDSDRDGVKDDVDQCPNTPDDEAADENGCSPSQRFTCGDEISDGWRIRSFGSVLCDGDGATDADPDKDTLTNAEEYRIRTDPMSADTDFDGWDDGVESSKGTDPRDPASHPPSKIRILLWTLLILLLLGALGVGGWMGYQYYLEQQAERAPQPQRPAPAPVRPQKRLRPWPGVIEKLRSIARREEPGTVDRDWMSLGELADRIPKEKVALRPDVFAKLQDVVSGKLPKKEAASVMEAIRRQPQAFALLRRISFEQLSPAEKQQLRKRVAMLKAGTLTSAELEDILNKLRITASYYRAHKGELEQELADWLGKKK